MIKDYFDEKSEALLLDIRKKIYNCIKKYPGLHFRELQRQHKLAVGNLDYHLNYLEKNNLIKVERNNAHKRFYPLGLNEHERNILGILRQKNFRIIIIKLLQEHHLAHKDLTSYLKISPSSVSWYLTQLIKKNILVLVEKEKRKIYQLKDKNEIIKILITYKESFVDTLIDHFIETFEK